jgi:hypothetical protein
MEYKTIEELDKKVLLIDSTKNNEYWNNPIKFKDKIIKETK